MTSSSGFTGIAAFLVINSVQMRWAICKSSVFGLSSALPMFPSAISSLTTRYLRKINRTIIRDIGKPKIIKNIHNLFLHDQNEFNNYSIPSHE